MGNEYSGRRSAGTPRQYSSTSNIHAASTTSSPPAAAGSSGASTSTGGISSSFSFLGARKRDSTKSLNQIVTVYNPSASTSSFDIREAEELKKIKEIPRFYPLLKGLLPGQRDDPAVLSRIDPKDISRFLHRLQFHFAICATTVCKEQSAIFNRIQEVNRSIADTVKDVTRRTKRYEQLVGELSKVDQMREQLDSIHVLVTEVARGLDSLNAILPTNESLPPLELNIREKEEEGNQSVLASKGMLAPIEETKVVDRR